jgi:uncharacterized protein YbjT (DUF2867 family)
MPSRRPLLLALSCLLVTACASTSQPSRDPVLVLGATGQLGAEIVRQLVAQGTPVVAVVRPSSDRRRLEGLAVDYVLGDVTQTADMERVLQARRYGAIVVALRVMNNDIHFYEKALTPISRLAKSAGVRQIIHHGAVGAGRNLDRIPHEGWDRIPGIFDRLKDQGVGEDLVRAAGVPYTIIRNARIYPDGTPSTGRAELTEDDSVVSPMTRADLAIFTARCLGNRACHGKVYHVRDPSLTWPPPARSQP